MSPNDLASILKAPRLISCWSAGGLMRTVNFAGVSAQRGTGSEEVRFWIRPVNEIISYTITMAYTLMHLSSVSGRNAVATVFLSQFDLSVR
jgi:hypothetical protein